MKPGLIVLVALCGCLALGSSEARAVSQPPIPVFPPAGAIAPPSGAIVDSWAPVTQCSDWYVQAAYGNAWGTNGGWWEYNCPGPGGYIDGDDPFWTDFFYWDGSHSVFYGQMYWQYDWMLGGHCAFWFDVATGAIYDVWGCSEMPTASFSYSCSGLTCDFDGTESSDSDGTIVSYDWSFGDGTLGSGVTVQHTFAHAGTFDVYLAVTDDLGWQGTTWRPVTVTGPNVAPHATFTFGCSGSACGFDGTGSSDIDGTIVAYAWDFGDGTSSSAATAQHSYAQAGTYVITLTVTDDDGASGTSSHSVVVAENAPPAASISRVCNGLTCTFDGRGSNDSDGSIVTYAWGFGDGTTGTGATAQHSYAQADTYIVTLTVTDDDGASNSTSKTIELISLSAIGRKVKSLQMVDLTWSGSSGSVDVYRNGARIVAASGASYSDNLNQRGGGTYLYKVCAVATSICSNTVTVTF